MITRSRVLLHPPYHTDKIFLIFKEIQSGAVAKSHMRKGFLKHEEMRKYFSMRRPLVIYDFATAPLIIIICTWAMILHV
jgi:hypothetical protein